MRILVVLCLVCLGGSVWASGSKEETVPIDYSLNAVQKVVASHINKLDNFKPGFFSPKPEDSDRHTPIIYASTPWGEKNVVMLEVPEYSWAHIEGDPYNGSPFYYGRPLSLIEELGWTMRFPSLETPAWKKRDDGGLELDNPLEGGYIQHFKVIPHDRMFEVRFGVTNNSDKELTGMRCQLCLMPSGIEGLRDRHPTTSRFLCDGDMISWDGTGQDVNWLDAYLRKDGEGYTQSCFYIAYMPGREPSNWADNNYRPRPDMMWLNKNVDVPAIAKVDVEAKHNLIVYSPFGGTVFYNALIPCYHADPLMNSVNPGETRWTVSYYIYQNGDPEKMLNKLKKLHKKLKRTEGVLEK